MSQSLDAQQLIQSAQRNEITEHFIYLRLAASMRDAHNRQVLERIAADELAHYNFWKERSGQDIAPRQMMIRWYVFLGRVFGLTFAVKLMEQGEEKAQARYASSAQLTQIDEQIIRDEERHERELIGMIDEERLKYVGSMVLGLNDALVELTGALAGFTLTLQRTDIIAVVGLITGIAASLSMAVSEYLSTKSEGDGRHPVRASLYTGVAYVMTVVVLILPFFFLENPFVALAISLSAALLIIALFNYYVSIAQGYSFRKRFVEMAGLSLGVAAVTFSIGFIVSKFFNIDV
ncbi:MAG: VIT1/CCC1 transporter family protein [Candidatus Kerfeldbacteria bacterium]|nr:VIT1/CCC1 transporter family protein [Candidatus Kerfeldbacteria bacterium]